MPLIKLSEVLPLLRNNTICSYSVDTNIFIKKRFNFFYYPLKGLLNLNTNVKFILPDVIYMEIEKNFIDYVTKNCESLKNCLSSLFVITDTITMHNHITLINYLEFCREVLSNYFNPCQQYIIKCSNYCNIDTILDYYFSEHYPFSKKDNKKNEFPDAFSLNCLENWSILSRSKVLLLTEDKGCMQYCKTSNNLYSIDLSNGNTSKIFFDTCISEIKYFDDENMEILASDIKNSIINSREFQYKLHDEIELFLCDMQNIEIDASCAYYYDFDIDDTDLLNILYDDIIIDIINPHDDIANNPINFNIHILINFSCSATFSIYVYDSTDKEYILIKTISKSVDKITELDIQVELLNYHVDMILRDNVISSLNISRDIINIDFGDIQSIGE